jgi:hypothetical protein
MTTIQFVTATALSLFVFVLLANLVVALYARGAVRAAIDEGARAGAPVDSSVAECERRANDALARAEVVVAGWIPGVVPDWSFTLTAAAVKEHEP